MNAPKPATAQPSPRPRRVFVLGATGTIGRATVRALVQAGHDVVCFVRPRAGVSGALAPDESAKLLEGASLRFGDVTDAASWRGTAFAASVSTPWCPVWRREPAPPRTHGRWIMRPM